MGTAEAWRAAWSAALDALELDVASVEAQLSGEHAVAQLPVRDPWQPPEGMGPIPLELRERADAILTRQIAAAENLARTMVANRQQAALLERVQTAQRHIPRPAYVDCAM